LESLALANNILGLLVVAKSDESGVPQVVIGRPFGELELAYEYRL